jgi:hypothetical protein
MKVLKIAGMSILALGLVLGIALPVLASGSASPQASNILPELLRGKVVSIDEDQASFIIQSGEQKLAISVNDGTKYFKLYVPGRLVALVRHRMQLMQPEVQQEIRVIEPAIPMKLKALNQMPQLKDMDVVKQHLDLRRLRFLGEEATFDDIAVGTHVAVRAEWAENSYLAKTVIIIKPTTYARVIGIVSNINEKAMEIAIEPLSSSSAEDGESILAYDRHTIFILRGTPGLQEGEKVVAIYMEKEDVTLLAKRVMAGVEPLELDQ